VTRRTERIGEQIRAEVARLIREEVTDPRVGMVVLTRVDVAPDLSQATLYFSTLESGEERIGEIEDGLESGASFLRRKLSKMLTLRRTPALHFRHDPSLGQGDEMLALIKEVNSPAASSKTDSTNTDSDADRDDDGA
jgi:ribosome-binding factor A